MYLGSWLQVIPFIIQKGFNTAKIYVLACTKYGQGLFKKINKMINLDYVSEQRGLKSVKKPTHYSYAELFTTGFLQVLFVVLNTYFVSKVFWIGVFCSSFTISMIWSYNVTKISVSTMPQRIVYSLGAALGAVFGLAMATLIHN